MKKDIFIWEHNLAISIEEDDSGAVVLVLKPLQYDAELGMLVSSVGATDRIMIDPVKGRVINSREEFDEFVKRDK